MLRTSSFWKILSLCLLAHASLATAQQANQQAKPSAAPPKLERAEDGSDTPLPTARPKQGGTRIKEKKEGGRVTEVQVQAGPSSYTMKPNTPAGNAQPGDATANTTRAPQWSVLEFDLNKKKKTGDDAAATADAPPPPPPPAK